MCKQRPTEAHKREHMNIFCFVVLFQFFILLQLPWRRIVGKMKNDVLQLQQIIQMMNAQLTKTNIFNVW